MWRNPIMMCCSTSVRTSTLSACGETTKTTLPSISACLRQSVRYTLDADTHFLPAQLPRAVGSSQRKATQVLECACTRAQAVHSSTQARTPAELCKDECSADTLCSMAPAAARIHMASLSPSAKGSSRCRTTRLRKRKPTPEQSSQSDSSRERT
jgi:hypothetical protein